MIATSANNSKSYPLIKVSTLVPKSPILLNWNNCGIVIKSLFDLKKIRLKYKMNVPFSTLYLRNFVCRDCILNQTLIANIKNEDTNGFINKINSCRTLFNSMSNKNRYTIYVFIPNKIEAIMNKGERYCLKVMLNPKSP